MIILMKCLNEERSAKRCVADFHDEPWVDKIIVIDGGSTDYTVRELLKFSKVEVYIHPWLDWYHNMEVSQSNIALSYVPNGEWCMIMDFDERMSSDLKKFLSEFKGMDKGGVQLFNFSRRTFELMRHEDSPFCMYQDDGWPVLSHQIHNYPDYQPRMIKKSPHTLWINSPHHVLIGWSKQEMVNADIIHYEKEDSRDRDRIEQKWAQTKARRDYLGLTQDLFEAVKPGYENYIFSDGWVKYWQKKGA